MVESAWPLSQTFEFRGQSVAYDVLGEGKPTVLVHGTPFSSYVWHTITRELARDRQVFLFDLLGYGQSEMREGQDVSLGVLNVLFAALLQHWELQQPDVVAHDFGGATVLRAHQLNGCDYRRLLLLPSAPGGHHSCSMCGTMRQHSPACRTICSGLFLTPTFVVLLLDRSPTPNSNRTLRLGFDRATGFLPPNSTNGPVVYG